MDVGLEVLLLTRLPSSFPWDEVPYSGDGEFSPAWDRPGRANRVLARRPSDPVLSERDRSLPRSPRHLQGRPGLNMV
jgi:hypothetical protein